ncbi:MAG: hypothetical protein ABSG65_16190 [Bryobacteraceae bacterium]|jgi:hypothetical protein
MLSVAGTLYGTTGLTVFEIDPSTTAETVLYEFSSPIDPISPLIKVGGALYSTTQIGGTYDDGTVYEVALPESCTLTDTLTYSSGTLTMNFEIGTPTAATWNAWLVSGSTFESIFSLSQPKTEPPADVTQTQAVPADSGTVGILSTLSTATGGITCSSWETVNTGNP